MGPRTGEVTSTLWWEAALNSVDSPRCQWTREDPEPHEGARAPSWGQVELGWRGVGEQAAGFDLHSNPPTLSSKDRRAWGDRGRVRLCLSFLICEMGEPLPGRCLGSIHSARQHCLHEQRGVVQAVSPCPPNPCTLAFLPGKGTVQGPWSQPRWVPSSLPCLWGA